MKTSPPHRPGRTHGCERVIDATVVMVSSQSAAGMALWSALQGFAWPLLGRQVHARPCRMEAWG